MGQERFLRQEMLLGSDAMDRLSRAHVTVFGIGGVGSYAAEALTRAGVGHLTFVDSDVVSQSNCNRQLIALSSTIGQPKAQVMAARARDINPACQVTAIQALYNAETREDFFARPCDLIVDCIDMVSAKLDLIQTALSRDIPIISALGTGNKLDPTRFQITDISKTTDCPLARVIRRELRARGIKHHTVLYSPEPARTPLELEPPPPGRRSVPGSVSWVPSVAGLLLAGWAVEQLVKNRPGAF